MSAASERESRREARTLRSYLRNITSLDDDSLEKLRSLLRITVDLRLVTSNTRRIQRGSPGAGELGAALANIRPRVTELTTDLEEVLQQNDGVPGMYLLRSQFQLFCQTLNENFNDGGNEPGYSDRVRLLEKLMYLGGTLRGHVEVILEQHSYWKAKLAGEEPPRMVRRLDFNQAADPAVQTQPQGVQLQLQIGARQGLAQGQVMHVAVRAQQRQPQNQAQNLQAGLAALQIGGTQAAQQQGNGVANKTSPKAPKPEGTSTQPCIPIKVNLWEHTLSGLIELWENRRHTDVTFIISNTRVTAHRAVLASQSEYFDRLLFGEMREAHPGAEIPLVGTPLKPFELLLEYAYSGHLKMEAPLHEVLDVVALADRFGFTMLKAAVGTQLANRIGTTDMVNVVQIMVHSDVHHLPDLHQRCLNFIDRKAAKNPLDVLDSQAFLSLPEDYIQCIVARDTFIVPEVTIFQALLKWKKHNSKSNREMTTVLHCVRLSEFSTQDLFAVVEPTHLFKESSILNAIRVQAKPDLAQTRPRGRKVIDTNFFKSSATQVMSPAMVSVLRQNNPPGGAMFFTEPPKCIAEGVVYLATAQDQTIALGTQFGQMGGQVLGYHGSRSLLSMKIVFNNTYLVNNLELEGMPDITGAQVLQKSFSYTVRISRDNRSWVTLFDYSKFSCFSKQQLCFPTQAVKYIEFTLNKRADVKQAFSVKFSCCSFSSQQQPFRFQTCGVIAPLVLLTPLLTASQTLTQSSGFPVCKLIFNQPYSIAQLRFKVCASGPEAGTRGDISVYVVAMNNESTQVRALENVEFGTNVSVQFSERVVSSVMVVIKKSYPVKKETPQASPKLPASVKHATTLSSAASFPRQSMANPFSQGVLLPVSTSSSTLAPVSGQSGLGFPLAIGAFQFSTAPQPPQSVLTNPPTFGQVPAANSLQGALTTQFSTAPQPQPVPSPVYFIGDFTCQATYKLFL